MDAITEDKGRLYRFIDFLVRGDLATFHIETYPEIMDSVNDFMRLEAEREERRKGETILEPLDESLRSS